jgi:MarR family transcriptional regulator, transcriptional regulator for hemolysin
MPGRRPERFNLYWWRKYNPKLLQLITWLIISRVKVAMMTTARNDEFLFLLHDLARLMRTRADQRARRRGMTRAQWVILIWLERQPGLSQNELAALVEVEPITVGRLVDRLEARGLVERCADPKDRRVWRLRLTPAASAVLDEIEDYRAELHDLITVGLDAAKLQVMTDVLIRMKANLLAELREPPKASASS